MLETSASCNLPQCQCGCCFNYLLSFVHPWTLTLGIAAVHVGMTISTLWAPRFCCWCCCHCCYCCVVVVVVVVVVVAVVVVAVVAVAIAVIAVVAAVVAVVIARGAN